MHPPIPYRDQLDDIDQHQHDGIDLQQQSSTDRQQKVCADRQQHTSSDRQPPMTYRVSLPNLDVHCLNATRNPSEISI